jgi:hypothetical protein
MQLEKLIGLMRGSVSFNEQTLADLENLLDEYPYFQTAHLFYTLNYRELKDTRFSFELRKTAAYLSDRKKLFFLIENKFFTPECIENLERKEEPPDSSFNLIDLFLAETKQNIKQSTLSSDYIPYFLPEEKEEEIQETAPMRNQSRIDQFLVNNEIAPVKIEWKEKESENDGFVSNLDNVDENSFFSETLAKIYLKQKKYGRALAIIRKLNLLYPEKNRYFADQIRFLEKLIINTKNS